MERSPDEQSDFSLSRFETMLKTNDVYFFDAEQFEDIIHHYLDNGKIALAKKATALGLEQHPTATSLKMFQVEMLIFEDRLDDADKLLDKLHLIEQSNEEVYIQKANVFSRRDNHKNAIKLLQKALAITHDKADVLSLLGMEHMFLEDYENAKHCFIQCLERDSSDYSALYNTIYCFEHMGQGEAAIEFLNVFLNNNPYCEVGWHQLGQQYYGLKQYKKALAAFDFAIISDDRFIGAYLEKGKVLEKLKQFPKAIEAYTLTLSLDDPTSFALLRMGKCYEKLGNQDLALHYFNKCVEEDGLLDKGWIAITDFYFRKKDYKKALYYIDKAIQIDTENVLYWKRFAKINLHLQNLEEAEHGYRKVLELGDHGLDIWLKRADLLLTLGEPKATLNNLQQAAACHPENAELAYRMAGTYFKLGENTKGEFHLTNALRLEPEFILVLQELFPKVYAKKFVQQIIEQHKKPLH